MTLFFQLHVKISKIQPQPTIRYFRNKIGYFKNEVYSSRFIFEFQQEMSSIKLDLLN